MECSEKILQFSKALFGVLQSQFPIDGINTSMPINIPGNQNLYAPRGQTNTCQIPAKYLAGIRQEDVMKQPSETQEPTLDEYFKMKLQYLHLDDDETRIFDAAVRAFISELAHNGCNNGFPPVRRIDYNRELYVRLLTTGLLEHEAVRGMKVFDPAALKDIKRTLKINYT